MLDYKHLDKLENHLKVLNIPYRREACGDGEHIVLTEKRYKGCDFAINSMTQGHDKGLLEWYGVIYTTRRDVVGYLTPTMCIIQIYHIKQYGYGYDGNSFILQQYENHCNINIDGLNDAIQKIKAL